MFDFGKVSIREALNSRARVSGFTHNFYRYPARFSPEAAREIIAEFSDVGDCIFDPFMGGGTSIVEALVLGRYVIGVDINPLAHFITRAKTTPLNCRDKELMYAWLGNLQKSIERKRDQSKIIRNLPKKLTSIFAVLISEIEKLPTPRLRRFTRCAILKTGQWAVDCRDTIPNDKAVLQHLRSTSEVMLRGMSELVNACGAIGISKNRIVSRRKLFCRSSIDVESQPVVSTFERPRLVLTSPPYPGVHVLYHRWQLRGRRETPAPYWIAALRDGNNQAFYTFGGRSIAGLEKYFLTLKVAFHSIKKMIHPKAFVIQLVAFSDAKTQLPLYLQAMHEAGYKEKTISRHRRITREVPNRKWYSRIRQKHDAAKEILLVHQPNDASF